MGNFVREKMMMPVYIAGDNIITSLGFTTSEVIQKVESGITGFRKDDDRSLTPSPVPLSMVHSDLLDGMFREILAMRHPEMREEHFTRLEKMFIISIHDAVKETVPELRGSNSLLVISSTKGNIDLLEEGKKNFPDPGRIYLWKMADVIGSFFGFVNRPVVISNACISGVLALSTAARMIDAGLYDHVVVAGGDILSEFVISGFLSFQALSPEPCKPFDINRNGLSLGEGCGTMVLSSKLKKSTAITVSGSAITNDANHISGPSRTGEELAMAIGIALKEAGMNPDDISFVSAHGTATLFNDEMESKALGIAGLQDTPVNSFKGYWGHTLGAAGVIESIATIRSMETNCLFRSAGFNEIGVSVPLNVIREIVHSPVQNCLKIASGFGGCNAAIVFRKM
jgi:3-oxoacyl-[acyl-carrier-protein] synthase-1